VRDGPQAPERLRPDGEGVQFTPFGIVPIGEATFSDGAPLGSQLPPREQAPTRVAQAEPQRRVLEQVDRAIADTSARIVPRSTTGVSPASVVKAAKSRVKELRAFLREAKKAEKELRELERLIAAAKKPLAPVREIRRSAS